MSDIRKSYVEATINHPQTPSKNTPNMASAANDSNLPSLSSPVPPCGNDSQRYRDGLPQLFAGQNWPLAATATGKHRHDASMMHRFFSELINSKTIISSSFNDIDLSCIMLTDCCVWRRWGRGTMVAIG
jgi:hypothetical protein